MPNWDISRGFLYLSLISAAAMGGAGDIIFIKKVRMYGRTGVYINFDPKWIKIDLAPSKNPSE